jgi:hypothetical protein
LLISNIKNIRITKAEDASLFPLSGKKNYGGTLGTLPPSHPHTHTPHTEITHTDRFGRFFPHTRVCVIKRFTTAAACKLITYWLVVWCCVVCVVCGARRRDKLLVIKKVISPDNTGKYGKIIIPVSTKVCVRSKSY